MQSVKPLADTSDDMSVSGDSCVDMEIEEFNQTNDRGIEFRGLDAVRVSVSAVTHRNTPIRTFRVGTLSSLSEQDELRTELDNHAESCVVSEETALIIHDFERPVSVFGYKEDVSNTQHCRTVSAVVAYDHPETGDTYYLVFHQSIDIPGMKANLLCPMQVRVCDHRVNDEPKYMALTPTDEHHAIVLRTVEDDQDDLVIPLSLNGVVSYFPCRRPSREEWEQSGDSQRIDMTSEDLEWDPKSLDFAQQEEEMLGANGRLREPRTKWTEDMTIAALNTVPEVYLPEGDFGIALEQNVASIHLGKKGHAVDAETLAKRWGISLKTALKTLQSTTQRVVRTTLHPTLSRRFRTNDRQLRYRRMMHILFSDTFFASTPSWLRKNICAQIYATSFGWCRIFPMRSKADTHETLSLLAARDGVPPKIVMDGSKEQQLG